MFTGATAWSWSTESVITGVGAVKLSLRRRLLVTEISSMPAGAGACCASAMALLSRVNVNVATARVDLPCFLPALYKDVLAMEVPLFCFLVFCLIVVGITGKKTAMLT
jgi:hypothetical protein